MSMTSSAGSSAVEALIDWCAAHPVPDCDAARCLRHLNSGSHAILDRREQGAVCVILDRARSGIGCAPLELVGCRDLKLDVTLAEEMVAAAMARIAQLGLAGLDLMLGLEWLPHRARIEVLGLGFAYQDFDLRCDPAEWGADMPLPDGLRWSDLDPARLDDFMRVYRAAFAAQPGVYFPDEAEQRRNLFAAGSTVRVLTDGASVAAALRFSREDAFIHSIVRDPALKGRGLGRLVLDEARRQLPGRALALNVVGSNRTAFELYRRLGFAVVAARDVLSTVRC
jgi:ribosomal protein S18 acetylase RimI-like enzyme